MYKVISFNFVAIVLKIIIIIIIQIEVWGISNIGTNKNQRHVQISWKI